MRFTTVTRLATAITCLAGVGLVFGCDHPDKRIPDSKTVSLAPIDNAELPAIVAARYLDPATGCEYLVLPNSGGITIRVDRNNLAVCPMAGYHKTVPLPK